MAHWSPAQLIGLVLKYHPDLGANPVVPAVAIALAESGGDDHAISPSHDYGLWQINRIHFGDGIINSSNWTDSAVQVHEMWSLSGGGHNWAAWCTAWNRANVGNCGHGYLAYPEPGSPADDHITEVQNIWNSYHGTPPPGSNIPPTQPSEQLSPVQQSEWNYFQSYFGPNGTASKQLLTFNNVMQALSREI